MEQRVLIGSRMRGHQRGRDRQLTPKTDTTHLVTTRRNCFCKHSKLTLFSILWLIFTSCWFVLNYPISLVNSIVADGMVSARKRKQQNKRLFRQLSERDTDFMIQQRNQDEQTESRDNMICRGTSSDNISNPTQVNYPQVDVHTLEENSVSKVRSEVNNVMTAVETRLQDTVLTAIANIENPRVELAMNSVSAPSGRSVDGNVLDLIRWIFWVISKAYKWPSQAEYTRIQTQIRLMRLVVLLP